VITTGGALKARFVIHTVGPIWGGGEQGEAALLRDCYVNCLALASGKGLATLSFPSISTGAYRFPLDRAARVALETVSEYLRRGPSARSGESAFQEVCFVLFSREDYAAYARALESIE
jgi:O-acetyl-ADP-ribose deacetylase (regulator of RNase III)